MDFSRHELMRGQPTLVSYNGWAALDYAIGPWFWVHALYSYSLLVMGAIIAARTVAASPQGTRAQLTTVLVAIALPAVANVLFLAAPALLMHYDVTPIALTVSACLLLWALFQAGLLDVMPIAREMILRNISDGVIVVDTANRIADINPAAERLLGCRAATVIGRAPRMRLSGVSPLAERLAQSVSEHTELSLDLGGRSRLLDLRISPLHDGEGRYAGRLVLFADVTEQRQAERSTRSSLARLATLIENLHMGVLVESDQGMVQHTNRFFVGLFELTTTPEALLERPAAEAATATLRVDARSGPVRGPHHRLAHRGQTHPHLSGAHGG